MHRIPALVTCIALSVVTRPALAEPAASPPPAPGAEASAAEPGPFTVGDPGRRFESSSARGRYLVVHFLLSEDCPLCSRLVSDYSAAAPTLAGVTQIFVKNTDPTRFNATLRSLNATDDLPLYRDADGALASRFRIPGGYKFYGREIAFPAAVVLDPAGKEVFRYVGKANTDRLAFGTLASTIARLSRDEASDESNLEKGLALKGYDPVSYLADGRAEEGKDAIHSSFKGITYRFASESHRAAFNTEPDKYVPAYGGWCATAMAEGRKVEIDPKSFKVTNGRVFVFYKGLWGNAINDWNKDEPGLTTQADERWSKLVAKKGGRR
ncbi:MAG: redoxin domain-containing protein [Phycisphaerales bacterium]|nr:redoxin domain-containing protein [Phycisphaerales bacterium]